MKGDTVYTIKISKVRHPRTPRLAQESRQRRMERINGQKDQWAPEVRVGVGGRSTGRCTGASES